MKIVVVSDTHGMNDVIIRIAGYEKNIDMMIHCGDICADADEIRERLDCPFYLVSGNMDFGGSYPEELALTREGHRIYVCHGHRHHVKFDLCELIAAAGDVKADIALYGHTHVARIDEAPGLVIMNPGSPVYPRSVDRIGSYGVIETDAEGRVNAYLKLMPDKW